MKNTIIGLKELRANMDTYIDEVEKGNSFTVVRRSKPVFRLSPAEEMNGGSTTEVVAWTDRFIERYRGALEALAKQ